MTSSSSRAGSPQSQPSTRYRKHGLRGADGHTVILVGDIERGGVIANMVGTYHLLESEERALLSGYIVNKFRGDVSLFDDGLARITQKPACDFGILPWFEAARRYAEDALGPAATAAKPTATSR